jgi:hypothetical protein
MVFDGEMAAAVAAACRKTQGVRAIRFSEWDPCFALAMRKGPATRMKKSMTPDNTVRVYSTSRKSWTTLKFVWSSGMSQRDISNFLSSMGENTFCGADLSRFDMSTWKDLDEAVCRVIDQVVPITLRKQYRYTEIAYRSPRVQARSRSYRLLLEYLTKYESASGRFWTSERGTLIHFLIVYSGLQAALDACERAGQYYLDYGQYWVMAMGDDSVHQFSVPGSIFAAVMLETYARYSYKVKPEWGDRTSLAYCGMVAVHAPDGSISMLPGPSFCASFPQYFQNQGKSQLVFAGMRSAAQIALEHFAAMMPCGGWAYIVASLIQPDGSCPFTFAQVCKYRQLILEGQYGPLWLLQYETTVELYIQCGHIQHGDEETCIAQVKRYCKQQPQKPEPRARLCVPASAALEKGVQTGEEACVALSGGVAFSVVDAIRILRNGVDAAMTREATQMCAIAAGCISSQIDVTEPPTAEVELRSNTFWGVSAAAETIACLAHPALLATTIAFDCGLHAALGVRVRDLIAIGLHHVLLAQTHLPLLRAARSPLQKCGFLLLVVVEILVHAAHNAAVDRHWRNGVLWSRFGWSHFHGRIPHVHPSEANSRAEAIAAEKRVAALEMLQAFLLGCASALTDDTYWKPVLSMWFPHIARNTLRVIMRASTTRVYSDVVTLPDPLRLADFGPPAPPAASIADALRTLRRAAPALTAGITRGRAAPAAPASTMLTVSPRQTRHFVCAVLCVVRRFFLVLIAAVQRRAVVPPVARIGMAVRDLAVTAVHTPVTIASVAGTAVNTVSAAVSLVQADATVIRAAAEGAASAVTARLSLRGVLTTAWKAVQRLLQYRLRVRITGPPTSCILCAARRLMRPHYDWLDSDQQPIVRDAAEARALIANVRTVRILAVRLGADIAREIAPHLVETHSTEASVEWSPDYVCMAQSWHGVYPYLRTLRESVSEHAAHPLLRREETRAPIAVLRGFLASIAIDAPSSMAALRTNRPGPVAITHRLVSYRGSNRPCLQPLARVRPLRPLRSPALTFLAGLLYCCPDGDGPVAVVCETAVFVGGVGRVHKHIQIRTPRGHLVYWKPPRCYVDYIQVAGLRASGLNVLSAALRKTGAFGCLVLRPGTPSVAPPDPYRSWLAGGYSG